MSTRRFGVSTHLFHEWPLSREHLVHVAAHGFEAIEVFATRSHFDYRDPAVVDSLAEWLSDTRLDLHSIHAPAFESFVNGQWLGPYSIASSDESRRKAAVEATGAALHVATRIPFRFLVMHVGVPATAPNAQAENHPDAARRSIAEVAALAEPLGVRVALEVIPNGLSGAATLASEIEDRLEGVDVGVCLDYGHAHMMGDLGDAIEGLSGHIWTTHVHDNDGRNDDHRVPFAGTIDWSMAMMQTQKIGYDGTLVFEVGASGEVVDVLSRMTKARERLEQLFITF